MKNLLKTKQISKKTALKIAGGTNEMHRETYINRRKSADKMHNKVLQYIMS